MFIVLSYLQSSFPINDISQLHFIHCAKLKQSATMPMWYVVWSNIKQHFSSRRLLGTTAHTQQNCKMWKSDTIWKYWNQQPGNTNAAHSDAEQLSTFWCRAENTSGAPSRNADTDNSTKKLSELHSLAVERQCILTLLQKYSDGQKMAIRISRQLTAVTKKNPEETWRGQCTHVI